MLIIAVAVAALAAACDSDEATVTVFAAASLREAFGEIAEVAREEAGSDPSFNFAGSQLLRVQIEQGARADVFASADARQMELAAEEGLVGETRVFAANRLVVVVREGRRFDTIDDLAVPGLRLVVGAPEVPIGAYTRQALRSIGADFADTVLDNVVSEEQDVKRVLTKVRLGEADAGVVYASDVIGDGASGVRTFPFPAAAQPQILYLIAPVRDGDEDAAADFIDIVLSERGRQSLAAQGFAAP